MHVVIFTRRPRARRNFSIEGVVEGIATRLPKDLGVEVAVSRYISEGLLPRLYDTLEAAVRQGDVNHIAGDIHFVAMALPGKRTMLTVHDCARVLGKTDFSSQIVKWLWFTLPVHHCAAVTVVSEETKRQLLSVVPGVADKIHVVPTFVSEDYLPSPRAFNAACPTLLHIGTAQNKNLLREAEALRGIRCKLVVVGPLSELQEAALARAGVDYRNEVGVARARMVELYQACDIVLFASTFEGFGMPIIEGNRVGRPVVTSDVTSMPEIARDAACLVDPFDVASIRAGILRVIEDGAYRGQLVQRGYDNAKRFEAGVTVQRYEALYRTLSAAAGPRRVAGWSRLGRRLLGG